jgi:hypothetical protein
MVRVYWVGLFALIGPINEKRKRPRCMYVPMMFLANHRMSRPGMYYLRTIMCRGGVSLLRMAMVYFTVLLSAPPRGLPGEIERLQQKSDHK